MKYKFEVWKYGIFDYMEAEEHLNQMAENGWLYRGKALVYGMIGIYEKNEKAVQTQYAVDTFATIDEEKLAESLQLFQEAGWQLIQPKLKSEQRVFCADKEPWIAVPYNDQESRIEAVSEALAQGTENFVRIFWPVIRLLLIYLARDLGTVPMFKAIGLIIITHSILLILITLMNCLSFARVHKKIAKGAAPCRTVFEKKLSSLTEFLVNGQSVFMFLAMVGLSIWSISAGFADNPIDMRESALKMVALVSLFLMVVRIRNLATKERKDIRGQLEWTFTLGFGVWVVLANLPTWF